jgi:hypothetical protein
MAARKNVHLIDGAYWFRIEYAARLAGTTTTKLRQQAYAGAIPFRELPRGQMLLPESAITALRKERGKVGTAPRPPEAAKLIDAPRRETGLYDRPQDQGILDWSRFPRKP